MFKNSKMKKILSSVLALAMIISTLAISAVANAAGNVAINKANFPDDIWRGLVLNYLDDGDGILTQDEISEITLMDVSGFLEAEYGEDTPIEIADLTGIEYFTSLKTLRVGAIGLESLDVSTLLNLESLTCQGNYLENIILINNDKLTELNCSANFIKTILLSPEINLKKLVCHTNEIKSINLAQHTNLEFLSIFQNELTTLDLSNNPNLSTLSCASNHLKSLDLSSNPLLSDIVDISLGNQTVEAAANYSAVDGSIYADFSVPSASRIVSTSLDRVEEIDDSVVYVKGYDGSSFVTYEPEAILGGIDYYYDVNLEGAANMSVHVNVSRDFFVVRYYDSETFENKLGEEIVNGGEAATFELSSMPQCKQFAQWSADRSDIRDDVQIYAIWQDDHNIRITSFVNGVATVSCDKGCGLEKNYVFADHINARRGDENYVEILDLNSDGIINAKDFARLIKGAY